jgi:hypothetical protein
VDLLDLAAGSTLSTVHNVSASCHPCVPFCLVVIGRTCFEEFEFSRGIVATYPVTKCQRMIQTKVNQFPMQFDPLDIANSAEITPNPRNPIVSPRSIISRFPRSAAGTAQLH